MKCLAFERITCLIGSLKGAYQCEKWANKNAAIKIKAEIEALIKEMNESDDRRPANKRFS